MGQAIYIAMFTILTLILASTNYKAFQPSAWYASSYYEIFAYVMYRTGQLGYIMAPLVFLFASRNNVLLWLTNWSHSTFMVLHRWTARVFALLAILHSILAVILYKKEGVYTMDISQPYWQWGIVATVMTVLLTFTSGLYIRNFVYEFWLITHIVFSVLLVAACWYHAYDLYAFLGGIVDFLYAVIAVWFFDRLMRILRIASVGPRQAKVTEIGEGHVRIDIPGIRWGSEPGKHVYAYFPTLQRLRFWENHPFSVLPTPLLQASHLRGKSESSSDRVEEHHDMEKDEPFKSKVPAVQHRSGAGLTLYVRKSTGMTKYLRANDSLLTFLEGPYPNNSTSAVLRSDRVLLICGGIGITGLLLFANNPLEC